MTDTPRTRLWISAAVYAVMTAILGRTVLANVSTAVANDAGDPLLSGAILHWNAHHVPWSEAWWQFPIFYPTRDVLAFSEHFLGVSFVAAPLAWITGDPLATYNIVTLLTFPLNALAMYLLVHRLTGSAAGAFIAGLVYGFAPYRISQLPHLQMLATFWAPLALLGLHTYVATGRRRWLALYGAGWVLQGAASGYALVFFSVFVGLWVLWFVVARARWRALGAIAAATAIAALPLVPILYGYVTVHARHQLERDFNEIRAFSADVAAVLCAPHSLTFWGWVRVGCRPEGELFPGAVVFALFVLAVALMLGWLGSTAPPRVARWVTVANRVFVVVAGVYALVVVTILIAGPWRIEMGPLRVSASGVRKPLLIAVTALIAAVIVSPGARAAARRSSTLGFYVLAAFATWILALGPVITFMDVPSGYEGPFFWLMDAPGMTGLRVPARFWLMTLICLAVAAGSVIAHLVRGRSSGGVAAIVLLAALGVSADGWVDAIGVQPVPPPAPDPKSLTGQLVLELPPRGDARDVSAVWRAVVGGWKTVNGYSGYDPSHYLALVRATSYEEDALFQPFQSERELYVIAPHDAPRLQALVERQPGAMRIARNDWAVQYRLPRRPATRAAPLGDRLPIASLQSPCNAAELALALDRDLSTRWVCPPVGLPWEITADLGRAATVGAVVHGLGRYYMEAPTRLVVETSMDARAWEAAFGGSVIEETITGAMADPGSLRIAARFEPRQARYVRLRARGDDDAVFYFTIAELEVWEGTD